MFKLSTELSLAGAITGVTNLRMEYDRFDNLITRKYGVIVKNWPLKVFCGPSAVGTRNELEVLFRSWDSGSTRFQKLTQDEMSTWEDEQFSSQIAMMSSSPLPTSTLASPSIPIPIAPVPPTSMPSPELTPLSPIPPEMVLFPEATGEEALPPTNLERGTAPTPSSVTRLPATDPQLVAEAIRLDPTLQSIDPALIMVGVTQGHHRPAPVDPATATSRPPPLAPSMSQNKRKWGTFEVIMPQSFGAHSTKRPHKERGGKRAKKNMSATGGENVTR